MYIPPFELFIDVVFKYATLPAAQGRLLGTITNHATGGNEYSMLFILKMYIHKPHCTSFFNQIACVGAKCICFAHAMTIVYVTDDMAVITSDIA